MRKQLLAVFTLLLLLFGCTTPPMKDSLGNYAEIYAESSNKQLLLNLARLQNHHPPYFFQMGNMSVYYNSGGSLQLSGSAVENLPRHVWPLSVGANTQVSASQSPTFNFIPLSGSRFSEQVLRPVPPDIFEALFKQGFPIDILMRVCCQRIDFTLPGDKPATGQPSELRYSLKNEVSSDNSSNFVAFLRVCGLLRDLQVRDVLHLQTQPRWEPIGGRILASRPNEEQLQRAMDAGTEWRTNHDGAYQLFRRISKQSFELNVKDPNIEQIIYMLSTNVWYANTASFTNVIRFLKPESHPGLQLSIELRSPIAALSAVAQEQQAIRANDFLRRSLSPESALLPDRECRPALRLSWSEGKNGPTLVSVSYRGKNYMIADEPPEPNRTESSWNRDTFALLLILMAQSEVDVTKVNYQGYLQIR